MPRQSRGLRLYAFQLWLRPEEKEHLLLLAKTSHLSASEVVRRLIMFGTPTPRPGGEYDKEAQDERSA
jgi:hypothetical protein